MAAEARRVRAEVREALRTGRMTVRDVLASDDEMVNGMKVKAMLTAVPGLGKIKSIRLMQRLEIAENRRIRGLGSRQRQALLDELA